MKKKVEEKINSIKNLLIEELNPDKIILFGSLAKMIQNEIKEKNNFDIDIFVEVNNNYSLRKIRNIKEKVDSLSGIYSVDLIFSNNTDLDFKKLIETTGVILYEKNRS